MSGADLENYLEPFHLTPGARIIVYIALIFLMGGIVLILLLFGSRIKKSYESRRTLAMRDQFQKILNTIVVNETFSQKVTPGSAFEYRMAELRAIVGISSFARQVLISQILDIKKNLSGSSAQALVATYYALSLEHHSMKKLSSLEWKKKALGIRELAEMGHMKSKPKISKFLNARNPVLREESFMALVRLDQAKPLSFLDEFTNDLTDWMTINIYHFLQKIDSKKIPDFSQWYDHPIVSVVLFSIRMTRQFRQVSSLPALADLVHAENGFIAAHAIEAIGEMDAFEYRDRIIGQRNRAWEIEVIGKSFLKCLGKIADTKEDAAIFQQFLGHPSYDIRFEAAQALRNLGLEGEQILMIYNDRHAGSLQSLLSHLAEPLLQ